MASTTITAPPQPSDAAPTISSTPSSAAPTERFNNSGPSSNLYLVTFLATLFLLLFVSCAIVLRSYILRRRYQRRLEEAMAAGMLLAPRAQGSKRKRFGTKPKLIDTWLADGGEKWDQMMPLAAQPVFVKRKYRDWSGIPKSALEDPNAIYFPANPADPSSSHDASAPSLQSRMRHLFRRPSRLHADSTPPTPPALNLNAGDLELVPPTLASPGAGASTSAATTPQSTTYKVRVEMLQVSVLIAMPSPSRTAQKNARLDARKSLDGHDLEEEEEDDEGKLPEVVIGVTRINHRQPKSQCPAIPPSPALPASGAVSVSAAPTRTSTPAPAPTSAVPAQPHES
ncbi:unnamed protein product [Cyclocybe aegerita]|uniref:Uncharacterized protein n=1 Tax=Cyclocybe aegerita TaxID=1973307 RepID=A0A8S0WNC7_CYCAE|nr:unnamed protein product [Cyclocybe aegerita]